MLEVRGLVSRIHRKRPKGRPIPRRTRRANAVKSAVRSKVEQVFAHQEGLMGTVVRTIGSARARIRVGLLNLEQNPISLAHTRQRRSSWHSLLV